VIPSERSGAQTNGPKGPRRNRVAHTAQLPAIGHLDRRGFLRSTRSHPAQDGFSGCTSSQHIRQQSARNQKAPSPAHPRGPARIRESDCQGGMRPKERIAHRILRGPRERHRCDREGWATAKRRKNQCLAWFAIRPPSNSQPYCAARGRPTAAICAIAFVGCIAAGTSTPVSASEMADAAGRSSDATPPQRMGAKQASSRALLKPPA
jgi:hypothetical protein